jgi:hypothetical protein
MMIGPVHHIAWLAIGVLALTGVLIAIGAWHAARRHDRATDHVTPGPTAG